MRHRPLHGEELTEQHWIDRLAKKYWFGDFGAYQAEPPRAEQARKRPNTSVPSSQ